jgi:hypothetical protein
MYLDSLSCQFSSTCSYGKKYVQLISKACVSPNNKRSHNILQILQILHLFSPLSVVDLVYNLQEQIALQCGQEIKLGIFLAPDNCYISYQHPACRALPTLDDGSPLPTRVDFHDVVWDADELGTSWNDNLRWKLTMYLTPST